MGTRGGWGSVHVLAVISQKGTSDCHVKCMFLIGGLSEHCGNDCHLRRFGRLTGEDFYTEGTSSSGTISRFVINLSEILTADVWACFITVLRQNDKSIVTIKGADESKVILNR